MRLVVKCGGAAGIDRSAVLADVAALASVGERIVLVHGGSEDVARLGEELRVPQRHLTSLSGARSRYTDAASLDVLTMALRGRVQPAVVTELQRLGMRAVGLSGLDGGLVEARRKPALKVLVEARPTVVRDDLSGRIVNVRPELLELLLDAGFLPVLSPPVLDPAVGPVNADADRLAAAVAAALRADRLLLLSNVPGLLRDPEDRSSLVRRIDDDLDAFVGLARGRMRLKLVAAREALEAGVPQVAIGAALGPAPVRRALAGAGTTIGRTPETRVAG